MQYILKVQKFGLVLLVLFLFLKLNPSKMIGNKIRYTYYYPGAIGHKEVHEGVVVDAYTAVKGKVEGMNFVIFGEVSGGVDSKRIYIVEYVIGNKKFYEEIKSWQLIEILNQQTI